MRILTIMLIIGFLVPAVSFADSQASLVAFFTAANGTWSGSGVANGNTPIQVVRTSKSSGASVWSVTSKLSGMSANPSLSANVFEVTAGGLEFGSNQQALAPVELQVATAQELSYETVHTDPIDGSTVTNTITMTLEAANTLHFVSDIYRGSNLMDHYDYVLTKTGN